MVVIQVRVPSLYVAHPFLHTTGDVVLGSEPECPRDFTNLEEERDSFVFDTCHWHWHFEGYASYFLDRLNPTTGEVLETIAGRKTGFCLLDSRCYLGAVKY